MANISQIKMIEITTEHFKQNEHEKQSEAFKM